MCQLLCSQMNREGCNEQDFSFLKNHKQAHDKLHLRNQFGGDEVNGCLA